MRNFQGVVNAITGIFGASSQVLLSADKTVYSASLFEPFISAKLELTQQQLYLKKVI